MSVCLSVRPSLFHLVRGLCTLLCIKVCLCICRCVTVPQSVNYQSLSTTRFLPFFKTDSKAPKNTTVEKKIMFPFIYLQTCSILKNVLSCPTS